MPNRRCNRDDQNTQPGSIVHNSKSGTALIALLLLSAAALIAAEAPYRRPAGIADQSEPLIVAGYRALFTCSAHFFAGRPLEDIKKVELVDTAELEFPDPIIDEERRIVFAADRNRNVQIAAYRDTMGCTILPPQLTEADIPGLPYIEYAPAPDMSDVSFPEGDLVQLGASGVSKNFPQLATVLDRAFDGQSFGENTLTVSVIIIKNERVIAERYRQGFGVHSGYRTWSTAKSLSAALLGIAARKGIVDFDGPAQVPEWQFDDDPRREITYKHLLWMSSGLYGGGNNTNAIYFGGQDVISAATTTRLEVEPGTRWKYSNNDTLLYLRALRSQLDDDLAYLRFPYDELFHRIGMYHTRMETDHLGNFIGSSQVYTTARDLARFGVLLANDGVWNDERILPEGWVEFSRSPAPTRPVQKGMRGYAAQFWLLDQMPGVPAGTFTSAGNKGQFVTVLPDHDIVIVRTGVDPMPARFNQDQLVAAVIELL